MCLRLWAKNKAIEKIIQSIKMHRKDSNKSINLKSRNKILNINGSQYLFNSKLTVLELMGYLGFNKNVIVIDYNGIILDKNLWKQTYLRNKDCLEILSIAGGG